MKRHFSASSKAPSLQFFPLITCSLSFGAILEILSITAYILFLSLIASSYLFKTKQTDVSKNLSFLFDIIFLQKVNLSSDAISVQPAITTSVSKFISESKASETASNPPFSDSETVCEVLPNPNSLAILLAVILPNAPIVLFAFNGSENTLSPVLQDT